MLKATPRLNKRQTKPIRSSKIKTQQHKKLTTKVIKRSKLLSPSQLILIPSYTQSKLYFSTTQQQQQPPQQPPQHQQGPIIGKPTPEDEQKSRQRFKEIVSSMNPDQQLVVQALVGENTMLRTNLNELSQMAQTQETNFQNVLTQLEQLKTNTDGNDNDNNDVYNANAAKEAEIDLQIQALDINSPTFFDDVIQLETNPRVRASLKRENQLRKEVEPMLQLLESASVQKRKLTQHNKRMMIALCALSGIVISQTLVLYTTGDTSVNPHITEQVNTLSTYLQEAVDIIQSYDQSITTKSTQTTPTTTSMTDNVNPSTKWGLFKEKLRLYNLSNPQHQIQTHGKPLEQ